MQSITSDDRMLQNLVVEYEKLADPRLPACSRKANFLLETCCTIMDAKGVSLVSIPSVYGYLQRASAISQNYYPERLGKLYIINAPWGFASAFSVVKKFLDPVTVAKIHILGSSYQTELLQQIPRENLPALIGGACECDAGCMFSDQGPWQDPQWVKPPKWAQEEKKDDALDATQSSSGVPETVEAAPPSAAGTETGTVDDKAAAGQATPARAS
jgi:CRAL/TRIO domain